MSVNRPIGNGMQTSKIYFFLVIDLDSGPQPQEQEAAHTYVFQETLKKCPEANGKSIYLSI